MIDVYDEAKMMPPYAVDTLVEIGRLADLFKADEITALRVTVLVGAELSKLVTKVRAAE